MTIQDIKQECIDIDIQNIGHHDMTTKAEIAMYYRDISLKKLLHIYSQYMGLDCLSKEADLTEQGYTIDILELLNTLNS